MAKQTFTPTVPACTLSTRHKGRGQTPGQGSDFPKDMGIWPPLEYRD